MTARGARGAWVLAMCAAGCSALAGRSTPHETPTSSPPASAFPEPELVAVVLDRPAREPAQPFTGTLDLRCDAYAWNGKERQAHGSVHLGRVRDASLRASRRGRLVVLNHYQRDSSAATRSLYANARHVRDRPAQASERWGGGDHGQSPPSFELRAGPHIVETHCFDCWRYRTTHDVRVGFTDTLRVYHGRATRGCDSLP